MQSSLHALLLLSDSALPLGSFAFSSGLESYLAHHKRSGSSNNASSKTSSFDTFLDLSLLNLASTSLPYVLTAHTNPTQLLDLDNDFDASTPCTVARRASVAQGRALITIWERALGPSIATDTSTTQTQDAHAAAAINSLNTFIAALKRASNSPASDDLLGLPPNAHLAPLFGTVCACLSLSAHETTYLFLLNHAKALLSAAVRASVMGPYQAQAVLASPALQDRIKRCVQREQRVMARDAGVRVPVMDLWVGRHELLYSRIFNS